jgi:lipoyl(octanoyl) transferase
MPDKTLAALHKIDLGRSHYIEAWDLQKKMVSFRAQGKIPDCLIITEHEPVITMGRGTIRENLLVPLALLKERGIDFFEIERGGDITFHGPGQTVLYPIIDLNRRGRDLHKYLRDLEQVIITTLEDLGLSASLKPGLTGVWVNDHKLAAIGVAVSKWVTYHGLALNVSVNLDYSKLIKPCGITEFPVGTLVQMLGHHITMEKVNDLLVKNFVRFFDYKIRGIDNLDEYLKELE